MTGSTARQRRAKGGIEVLASGALRVKVYAGWDPVSKKRHYLTETIPAGPQAEKQAEKVRIRLVNEVNERRNPRTKATLNQLIEKYLGVANLDPGTRRGYERNFRNHVKPLIGGQQVGKVDAQMLDSFYAELQRCRDHCDGKKRIDHRTQNPHECDHRCGPHECMPLAPSTVRRIHFLLSGAFSRAVRWGWIAVNPASMADPPPKPPPNPEPPSPEEAARILNASWEDPDWHAFVWTAMTTGARRAELCALRWRHVDLKTGTLTVKKSIDQNGGETTEKDTKTHQHRRIALDLESIAVVTTHRARCEANAESIGTSLSPDAYVFSLAPDGATPLKPDSVTQRYGRLAARLGIKTTIHKLRHYSATERLSGVALRAWLTAAHGEALAARGDEAGSLAAFDQAQSLPCAATAEPDQPFVAIGSSQLDRWQGHALARLGHRQAPTSLTSAVIKLDATFVRAEASLRVDLATAFLGAGEPELAQEHASRAVACWTARISAPDRSACSAWARKARQAAPGSGA